MASEEPEDFLGDFGKVTERSVCASEETKEALGGFGGTRRLCRWLRMSHNRLVGFGAAGRRSGW